MDKAANRSALSAFLTAVGQRLPSPEVPILLGGSGLHLLGSGRPTLALDFAGVELKALRRIVADAARSAAEFDLNPRQMRGHLALVEQSAKGD